MPALLEHLRIVNELEQDYLEPVIAHYSLSDEIAKAEEKKRQAAIDEDYETAAMLKKQILKLKDEALNAEKLRANFLSKVPMLSNKAILEGLSTIDPSYTTQVLRTL